MFTNNHQRAERTGNYGTPKQEHLQDLVTKFQTAKSEEEKENIVVNLANFAYNPYNYAVLRQLNVLELFIDCLTEPNECLVEFGGGGICSAVAAAENAGIVADYGGVPALIGCLSSPVRNTVKYTIAGLYYLLETGCCVRERFSRRRWWRLFGTMPRSVVVALTLGILLGFCWTSIVSILLLTDSNQAGKRSSDFLPSLTSRSSPHALSLHFRHSMQNHVKLQRQLRRCCYWWRSSVVVHKAFWRDPDSPHWQHNAFHDINRSIPMSYLMFSASATGAERTAATRQPPVQAHAAEPPNPTSVDAAMKRLGERMKED
ncbi:hypothetical protein Cgig2_003540 [Carnegiea gigantea]|uniref:Armadillo repeat-containing protein 7 n=1 Tax=Carnegiea gigantea TaxID=171969 RepID=A0A9Q1JU27_9CARY|nr:hypothetical protein Cgig2_003540 [Carnegiea gigantea]